MVCPYRLVTTFFAAVASMFYIRSTFADDVIGKSGEGTAMKKKVMSSEKRALIVSLLIVLHVDLLVTGYLRAGVKEGFAMLSSWFLPTTLVNRMIEKSPKNARKSKPVPFYRRSVRVTWSQLPSSNVVDMLSVKVDCLNNALASELSYFVECYWEILSCARFVHYFAAATWCKDCFPRSVSVVCMTCASVVLSICHGAKKHRQLPTFRWNLNASSSWIMCSRNRLPLSRHPSFKKYSASNYLSSNGSVHFSINMVSIEMDIVHTTSLSQPTLHSSLSIKIRWFLIKIILHSSREQKEENGNDKNVIQ